MEVTNVEIIDMRPIDGSNRVRYIAVINNLAIRYQTVGNLFNVDDKSNHLSRAEWIEYALSEYINKTLN